MVTARTHSEEPPASYGSPAAKNTLRPRRNRNSRFEILVVGGCSVLAGYVAGYPLKALQEVKPLAEHSRPASVHSGCDARQSLAA